LANLLARPVAQIVPRLIFDFFSSSLLFYSVLSQP
jgi:hypothetical protein